MKKNSIHNYADYERQASIYKALANPTRLHLVELLDCAVEMYAGFERNLQFLHGNRVLCRMFRAALGSAIRKET